MEPMKLGEFFSIILDGLGYQRPMIKLPLKFLRYIILIVKWMDSKMGSTKLGNSVPMPDIVQLASCSRTFNCSAAQKHIGYSPIVSVEEGITLTVESFSHLAKALLVTRNRDLDATSKMEKVLGSGKVADILLWRDEKKSFSYFLALVLLYYWFFFSGRTFISSTARLLMFFTIILFGYERLPSSVFGFSIPKIPLVCFEISQKDMEICVTIVTDTLNMGSNLTRSMAQGEDWVIFFKVAVSLYFFKAVVAHSLTLWVGVALVLVFTAFFVYEQYEEEIDGVANDLIYCTRRVAGLLLRNLPVHVSSLLPNSVSQKEGVL